MRGYLQRNILQDAHAETEGRAGAIDGWTKETARDSRSAAEAARSASNGKFNFVLIVRWKIQAASTVRFATFWEW